MPITRACEAAGISRSSFHYESRKSDDVELVQTIAGYVAIALDNSQLYSTLEQKAAEVARLPSLVPSLRAFHAGADLGLNQGNFDFAVTADFDDADGYVAYRDHPEHRAIISQFIQPIAAQRVAVQYEV